MKKMALTAALSAATLTITAAGYSHTVEAEALDRGLVAVGTDAGVFLSWRSLASDPSDMTYDLFRDGVKVNSAPIERGTNYTDATAGTQYELRCVSGGEVVSTATATPWAEPYLRVHLDRPEGGVSPAGGKDEMREYTYTPDDVSVGDVDGDGQYELFVKWFPTNQADNSFRRYTGNTYIDCYKMDGTRLWRVDLGVNIRSGNHYTQFMVYDFDGDGRAEMLCKTAPGTIDGTGAHVLLDGDDPAADYRATGTNAGIVIKGPEYLTAFDGLTGAALATVPYNPPRDIHPINKSNWGDDYGNRCERYLACVAYLDGEHPSAVFCRGYYTYSYLWAVDFDGRDIKERWLHVSDVKGKGAYGEGAHCITVGDVDADGCDEIIYGSAAIDHDGSLLYRTGSGHGDALHLAAMVPGREGLQVFMPHEEKSSAYKWDADLRDAATGEIIFGNPQSGEDNGRGLAANVSANWPGYEYWSSTHRTVQNQGVDVGQTNLPVNFRIYWDGDLLDELLDGTAISKPDASLKGTKGFPNLAKWSNAASCNGTKKTPNLQADILGDWREEVILHDGSTESDLLIFTTTIPTDYRVTCLMQDRQYREAIAWQNVAYNQPPHLSYNLEEAFSTAAAISVTSGALNQVVTLGEEIAPIRITVRNADDVRLLDAPEWMCLDFDVSTMTGVITGVPAAEGEYAYAVETVGANDGPEALVEGVIAVRAAQTLTLMAQYTFDTVGETVANSVCGESRAAKGAGEAVDGVIGGALSLNGSNYYVQEGYEALDFGDGSFTVSLWLRSTDEAAYILHKGSTAANAATGATGNWVGIELKNGLLKFAVDDDVVKTGLDVSGASQWFDGAWHQVVLVRDREARTLTAYVDGEAVGSVDDQTGAIGCKDEAMVIGNVNTTFNNGFAGALDHLSIWSGAMSPGRIAAEYAAADPTGITDITTTDLCIVVDAMTGAVVREGAGFDVVDGLDSHRVYVVVRGQQVFKVKGKK